MATVTPGAFWGVFKENNVWSVTKLSAMISANSSPAKTGVKTSGNGANGDQEMVYAWDEDDGE